MFSSEFQNQYFAQRCRAFEAVRGIQRIDLLNDDFSSAQFRVISKREGIDAIVGDAQVILIGGAYFGDEAKGKWGNALVHEIDFVIRPNSGANTGRTVVYNGKKLSLHLIPTGLIEGKRSIIGAETVGDPVSLEEEELKLLRTLGIDCSLLEVGNFFITTPYHRIMDVLGSGINASTGVGITPTHEAVKRKTCPRLDDLFAHPDHLRRTLKKDLERSYAAFVAGKQQLEQGWTKEDIATRLKAIQQEKPRVVPPHVLDFAQAHDPLEFLVDLYTQEVVNKGNFPKRVDANYEVKRSLERGLRLLVEITQSHPLSNARQQGYRYSTSADVTMLGALASIGVSPLIYKTVGVNVNKFPASSRVGPGNIPGSFVEQNLFAENKIDSLAKLGDACSDFDAICERYFNAVGENGILEPVTYTDSTGTYEIGQAMAISNSRHFDEKGATTGKPRITGLFDCVLEKMVADEQGPNTVISCMDRGNDCEKVGLVVAYVVCLPSEKKFKKDEIGTFIDCNGMKYRTGRIIRSGEQVPTSDVLQYCVPIIKVMEGWKKTPLNDLKEGDLLPSSVNKVLGAIEHYTGFNVKGIGIGPESDQVLYLRRSS